MTSKILNLSVLLGLFLGLTGCDQFLKGKPQPPKIVEIQASDLECVKNVQADFKKLVESQASEQNIDDSFSCLYRTLDQFKNRAEGRANPDAFTSGELFIIFDTFFKDAEISQHATDNLLVLKKALLGGVENEITKPELDLLKDYLKVLHIEVKNLSPYIKVFTFKKENGPFDQKTINLAFSQLRSSLKTLLTSSKIPRAEYNFEDVKQLTTSLNIVEDQDLLNLVENVVNLLAGKDPLKSEAEYIQSIDNFVDISALYAEALYTGMKFEIAEKSQLNRVLDFTERLITAFEGSLQYTKTQRLPIKYLDPIIGEVLKAQIIPVEVSEASFQRFYKMAVIRIFNDQKNLDPVSLETLRPVNFRKIKREFHIYKTYQEMINSLDFGPRTFLMPSALQEKIKAYNFTPAFTKMLQVSKLDQALVKEIALGAEELRQEALTRLPILFRDKKYVVATSQNTAQVDWEDVSRSHYTKMLARELMLGWGQVDPSLNLYSANSRMVKEDFVKWYNDFKEFAIELKLFDPRATDNGADNFMQADLFTYAGNGDNQLHYLEVQQFVNMLLGGGAEMTDDIQKVMTAAGCAIPGQIDIFGKPWFDERCFLRNIRANSKRFFSHVYLFGNYVNSLNDQEYLGFYTDFMNVARLKPDTVGRIETADIRAFSLLAMFIDSLFTIYDVKGAYGEVGAAEIRSSYPRFKNFVAEYIKKPDVAEKLKDWDAWYNVCKLSHSKEEFLQEAFIFLVYNGRIPERADVSLTCNFGDIFKFEGNVNRRKILSTFQILKDEIALSNGGKN